MYAIAFVIWIVWVRPEPWSGRSEAIRYCPLGFWIAEHDDAGKGVAARVGDGPADRHGQHDHRDTHGRSNARVNTFLHSSSCLGGQGVVAEV